MSESLDTEKSLDEAAKVRYLGPDDFVLMKTQGGSLRLTLTDERSFLRVGARRCFPFASPSGYVSLRDAAGEEVGIVKDLGCLPDDYRRWIEAELDMRYFTPRVQSIESIKHRFGGVEWRITTDRGAKRLITKGVHDTMMETAPGRYIITDVDGNRYELAADTLDEESREKLDKLV